MAVEVQQKKGEEITKQVLAEAIVKISQSFTELRKSGLNKWAITELVHASAGRTKVSKRQVNLVLDALEDLKAQFCR